MEDPALLTTVEAAAALGVSTRQFQRDRKLWNVAPSGRRKVGRIWYDLYTQGQVAHIQEMRETPTVDIRTERQDKPPQGTEPRTDTAVATAKDSPMVTLPADVLAGLLADIAEMKAALARIEAATTRSDNEQPAPDKRHRPWWHHFRGPV